MRYDDKLQSNFRLDFNRRMATKRLNGDFILTMAPAILIALLLGQTPLLFPFRIFTTTLHEAGHAIAGVFTGAKVGQIVISPVSSSITQVELTKSTVQTIIVASAGYLGSTLFGGILLLLAKNPRRHRQVMLGVAGFLFLILIAFIHNPSGIFVFMVITMALAVALRLPELLVTFSLYMLALLSCFNSVLDLLYLVNITKTPNHTDPLMGNLTDALILQNYTGVSAITWATSWSLLGGFMIVYFVLTCLFVRTPHVSRSRLQMSNSDQVNQMYKVQPIASAFYTATSAAPLPTNSAAVKANTSADDEILLQSLLTRYSEPSEPNQK